jgi:hypothetical protein
VCRGLRVGGFLFFETDVEFVLEVLFDGIGVVLLPRQKMK